MNRLVFLSFAVLSPIALFAQGNPPLSSDEVDLVKRATTNLTETLASQREAAAQEGSDVDVLDNKITGAGMLQSAIISQQWPSEPPSDPKALRRWLYIEMEAISASSMALGMADRAHDSAKSSLYDAVVRKLGDQYSLAVKDISESQLKSWGYFTKTYSRELFKADPTFDPSWSATATNGDDTAKTKSKEGPLQILINVASGETIFGERRIKVNLKTQSLPTKAELYVGDELRATSESKPFNFVVDSLDEQEGELNLKIVAFDEAGDKAELPFKLKVDNQTSKGVAYHLDRARNALAERDYVSAQKYGKVALKSDPNNTEAKIIVGSASFMRGQVDIAEKFGSDVESVAPDNIHNLQLLASVNTWKVFELRSQDNPESTRQAIMDAIVATGKYRHRIAEIRGDVAAAKASTEIAKADAYINAEHYSLAAATVKPQMERSDYHDGPAVERYAFCMVRLGRYADAVDALSRRTQIAKPTPYLALLDVVLQDALAEDTSVFSSTATAENVGTLDSTGVRFMKSACLAFMGFHGGRAKDSANGLNGLLALRPNDPITMTYLLKSRWNKDNFDGEQSAVRQVMDEDVIPTDILIEQGCELAAQVIRTKEDAEKHKNHLLMALAYFNGALASKPDSVEALAGSSLIHGMLSDNGKNAEEVKKAVSFARAATSAGPKYALGWITLSVALKLSSGSAGVSVSNLDESAKALEKAIKIDKRLATRASSPNEAWGSFMLYGRAPLIPAPDSAD